MMETIVNKIIEIDHEADQRLNDAESAGMELVGKSEKEAAELKESLRSRAENRIEKIREFHRLETEDALSAISEENLQQIKQLDESFEKLHVSIEDSIFRAIVGECVD